jgi:hypothetical protein
MPLHLRAAATEVLGDVKYATEETAFYARGALVDEYEDALWSIKEVGRTYPRVVKNHYGWDVILLTGMLPAKTYTRDEAAAEAFPEVRLAYFNVWVDQIARSLGVKIDIDRKQVEKLEELGP